MTPQIPNIYLANLESDHFFDDRAARALGLRQITKLHYTKC